MCPFILGAASPDTASNHIFVSHCSPLFTVSRPCPAVGAGQISSPVNAAEAIRALTIKSSARLRLACDARNDAPHLWAADVCGLVAAGAREWHGHPSFSYAHENHAGVCAFVSMPDRCVSFAHGKRGPER